MKQLFLLLTFAALLVGCGSDDTPEAKIEITPEIYEFLGGDANKRLVYDADGNRVCWVLTEFEYYDRTEQEWATGKIGDMPSFMILTFSDDFILKHYFIEKINSIEIGKVSVIAEYRYRYNNDVLEWIDLNGIKTSPLNIWIEDGYYCNYVSYEYINGAPDKIRTYAYSSNGFHLTYAYVIEGGSKSASDTYTQALLSDYPYIK